jgi:hypothetical protein
MFYEVSDQTINNAYKPFDIVTNKNGDVGFIKEVNVNDSQETPNCQVSYSVRWLVGTETKCAWFSQKELKVHCNLFVEIAKNLCHPFGDNSRWVDKLMKRDCK